MIHKPKQKSEVKNMKNTQINLSKIKNVSKELFYLNYLYNAMANKSNSDFIVSEALKVTEKPKIQKCFNNVHIVSK